MTKSLTFPEKLQTVLNALRYRCDVSESHRPRTKAGIKYYFPDMFPPIQGQEELREIVSYLKSKGLDISITFDIDMEDPGQYTEKIHLGLIKGENIVAIKQSIDKITNHLVPPAKTEKEQVKIKNVSPKEKGMPKMKITSGHLHFGEEKIPVESGQHSIADLLLKKSMTFYDGKVAIKGTPVKFTEIKEVGRYNNEASARDALKKLRKKIADKDWHVSIVNSAKGMYQLVIRHDKNKKTRNE